MNRKRAHLRPGQPKAFSRRAGLFVRLNLTLPLTVAKALRDTAAERLRAIEGRVKTIVAEAEAYIARPLSPEVARFVDAAMRWCDSDSGSAAEAEAFNDLAEARGHLPSPLPVVVTCGECERADTHCNWKEAGARFCGLGKRREG